MDLARPRDIRITCAPALASWLSDELAPLELPVIERTKTGVITHGTWTDTWRLCLELRTALQVLYPLETFRCRSPEDLYRQARSMAWETIIAPDGYLTVESRVDHPSINNSMFPNLRRKDAIVERIHEEIKKVLDLDAIEEVGRTQEQLRVAAQKALEVLL